MKYSSTRQSNHTCWPHINPQKKNEIKGNQMIREIWLKAKKITIPGLKGC